MNPRTFVISNNIKFSHYSGSNSLDPLIFNDFIAEACLKSITSNPSTDGLLTICVGSKSDVDDEIRHRHGRARCCADSYLHTMQNSFLFESKSDLKVDLQEDVRERDLTIKSASWPTERTRMESRRPLGVAETIMYKTDPSSELKSSSSEGIFNQIDFNIVVDGKPSTMMLSEGLTSNLFVCENNRLITAAEGDALSGSMSRIVIAAAQALGISIERRSPQINPSEPNSWSSAFLTSVSRPMHMIKSVVHPDGESMFELPEECETVSAIREAVCAALRDKENAFLRAHIPYPLWSEPLHADTSEAEMRRIFRMHSDYL